MKNKYILPRDQLLQNPLAHSHLLIISPFKTPMAHRQYRVNSIRYDRRIFPGRLFAAMRGNLCNGQILLAAANTRL
jgi:hypothetical protein